MSGPQKATRAPADLHRGPYHLHPADPLTVWSWTCPTCGAEMPRDAIPGHDHDAPTGGAIVWLLAAVVVALVVVVIVRWPR